MVVAKSHFQVGGARNVVSTNIKKKGGFFLTRHFLFCLLMYTTRSMTPSAAYRRPHVPVLCVCRGIWNVECVIVWYSVLGFYN